MAPSSTAASVQFTLDELESESTLDSVLDGYSSKDIAEALNILRLKAKAGLRANKNQDTMSSTKKEVFLTTFDLDNVDEDGSIKAAREAYWKSLSQALIHKQSPEELYATPESLVQTVNKGSSDFVY